MLPYRCLNFSFQRSGKPPCAILVLKLAGQSILFRITVIAVLSLILQSCRERRKPLSACRAQIVKHADSYVSRHIPTSEWQPIIEAEIKKCIEEERAK